MQQNGLSRDGLLTLYRNMLLQRAVDTRGFQLSRQGKIAIAMGSEGEAVQAGTGLAFVRGKDLLYRHAVGAAWALRARHEFERAVFARFGDGATSSGEWHQPANFAAVPKLPVIFLCENNQRAISTLIAQQMAAPDVQETAAGYGMRGTICDGFDPVACRVPAPLWSKRSAIAFWRKQPRTTSAPTARKTMSRASA